jgi:dolichol-phosphate mannosyltransferase
MQVSILLISLNEGSNLVRLCQEIQEAMFETDFEILIVEDGAKDESLKFLENLAAKSNTHVIKRKTPNGLAGAIKTGIAFAKGKNIIVLDGDGTHDPLFIPALLQEIQDHEIVIASRFIKGGMMIHPLHRQTSKLFNIFISKFLNTGVSDNLGGFFALQSKAAKALAEENVFIGHGDYFIRLVLMARIKQYNIIEIPTVYRLRFSGKPSRSRLWMVKIYLKTIWELKNVN